MDWHKDYLVLLDLSRRKNMHGHWISIWGVMLITNAVIQGGYEIFILGWSKVCLQTYVFLVLGLIALVSLLSARKNYNIKTYK